MEQYDEVIGSFTPKHTDDLIVGADKCIGISSRWKAQWIIEEGRYAGMWAMSPRDGDLPFAWVPECDLTTNDQIKAGA
jgi:hypothetical protein